MKLAEKILNDLDQNPITPNELLRLETYLDNLFKSLNIDIEFTRHFLDRVNDSRNGKQITLQELATLFKGVYNKYGTRISALNDGAEGVLNDMRTDINLPFVIEYDERGRDINLISKTVMRKRGFKTNTKRYVVSEAAIRLHNSLGIKRKDMPQIEDGDFDDFLNWLRKQGINFREVKLDVNNIKPSQIEVDADAAKCLISNPNKLKKNLIVSDDMYVIDGHHRWYCRKINSQFRVAPTYLVHMNAIDLIEKMKDYKNVVYKSITNKVVA